MPPLAKVYEALGAIGDGRVRIEDSRRAFVTSSEGTKTYEVESSDDGAEISSNDNASFWQGYLGYPAIAVMIARGLIAADKTAVRALAGVPWKQLNARYRNNYDRTLEDVMQRASRKRLRPGRDSRGGRRGTGSGARIGPAQGPTAPAAANEIEMTRGRRDATPGAASASGWRNAASSAGALQSALTPLIRTRPLARRH